MADRAGRASEPATDDGRRMLLLEREAISVVERLPELLMEADRIASTVAHGIHGRRRSGPGETFWQFRPHQSGEAAHLVDWRRSASSDHLYVREREWEAAHTLFLWPNISRSMEFRSHLSPVTKAERALVLMLAATELLVRGGERVALLGVTQPTANRRATQKLAEALLIYLAGETPPSEPPATRLVGFQPSSCSRISWIRSKAFGRRSTLSARRAPTAIWCRSSIPPRRRCLTRAARNSCRPTDPSGGSRIAPKACANAMSSG